jgi:uncharacterized lipoprotein
MRHWIVTAVVLSGLAGCSALPSSLRAPQDMGQDFPKLLPLEALAGGDSAPLPEITALEARAADQRRRAAVLRDEPL